MRMKSTLAKMKVTTFVIFGLLLLYGVAIRAEDDAEADQEVEETEGVEEDDDVEIEEDNDVLVLTEDNFDDAIAKYSNILVEFYAPWCGHCKSLAPEYEKAAGALKSRDSPAKLGKVDATVHNELGSRFEVSGYPTLKYFKDGAPTDYDGPREAQGIENWVLERSDPDWKPPPDDVVVLTSENFDDFVHEHDLSLVEFYAPWCGHCKKLAPEYSAAAKQLKDTTDPAVPLAKVDATEEPDLAKRFDVTGYPTLKMFRKGREFEYKGGRDKWGIVEYMQKQVGDASQLRTHLHNVKLSVLKEDITVFGFFENEEAEAYKTYQDAASDLREDYTMYHCFDEAARKEFKANANSVIIFNAEQFHSKHEPKWRTYEMQDDTDMEDIISFIKQNSVPLVGELTEENKEKRYGDKKPVAVVFYTVDFSFDHRDATQLWRRKIVEIAKDFNDLTFVVADDEKMKQLFKEFGFEDSGADMNIGILDGKGRKFPMEEMDDFDDDDIRAFIKKYQQGKVKPRVKSQPKPKSNKGAVTVVVGKTFEEIVMDKSKDVLVEFYAPWCGHCKKLDPIYKDLGKKYKKVKDLVIAKMDATANDVPGDFEVSGFPTIFWVPKDNIPVKYEGGRTLDDFVEYVEENSGAVKNAQKVEL